MARRYWIAVPKDVYERIKNVKVSMEGDIQKVVGKRVPLTFPKVLKAVFDPALNENYIQVDLGTLTKLAREKRQRWKNE